MSLLAAFFHCKRRCCIIQSGREPPPEDWQAGADAGWRANPGLLGLFQPFPKESGPNARTALRICLLLNTLVEKDPQWSVRRGQTAVIVSDLPPAWKVSVIYHNSISVFINLEWAAINYVCRAGPAREGQSYRFIFPSVPLFFSFHLCLEQKIAPHRGDFRSCQTFIFAHPERRNPRGLSHFRSDSIASDSLHQIFV